MDYVDPRLVLAGILGSMAAGFVLLANITAYWQVIPFALLYGTAFWGMIPVRSGIIGSYFGTQRFGPIQGFAQSAPILMGGYLT